MGASLVKDVRDGAVPAEWELSGRKNPLDRSGQTCEFGAWPSFVLLMSARTAAPLRSVGRASANRAASGIRSLRKAPRSASAARPSEGAPQVGRFLLKTCRARPRP